MILGLGQKPQKLDVSEAYILWRLLANRHLFAGHIQHLKGFTNDKDFLAVLDKFLNDWTKEARLLEAELEKHSLKGVPPAAPSQGVKGNSGLVADQESADVVFALMRLDVSRFMVAYKNTFVNDSIRELLFDLLRKSVDRIDAFIKYLKLKNWIQYPPVYPHAKTGLKDKIAVNEVFLIWDHLAFRYSSIRKTQLYAEMTAEPDFRALLQAGMVILKKQAEELEHKLVHFGIVAPQPFSNVRPVIQTVEAVEDRFMFSDILRGMQDALALHGTGIEDVILNDDLRQYFINLTLQEISLIDKMIKYGRLRGWVNLVPVLAVD